MSNWRKWCRSCDELVPNDCRLSAEIVPTSRRIREWVRGVVRLQGMPRARAESVPRLRPESGAGVWPKFVRFTWAVRVFVASLRWLGTNKHWLCEDWRMHDQFLYYKLTPVVGPHINSCCGCMKKRPGAYSCVAARLQIQATSVASRARKVCRVHLPRCLVPCRLVAMLLHGFAPTAAP